MKMVPSVGFGALLIATATLRIGSTAEAGREMTAAEGNAILGASCWTYDGIAPKCCFPHYFGGDSGLTVPPAPVPLIYGNCIADGFVDVDCPCAGSYQDLPDGKCQD